MNNERTKKLFAGNVVSGGLSNETELVALFGNDAPGVVIDNWLRAVEVTRSALPLVKTEHWLFKSENREVRRHQTACISALITKRNLSEKHRMILAHMFKEALLEPPKFQTY